LADTAQILSLIRQLAAYEREPATTVRATEASLRATLFPAAAAASPAGFAPPYARVLLAFLDDDDDDDDGDSSGAPAGMAIYFASYSTWRAAPGVYLEDLFVREPARGRGVGTALLAALARETRALGGERLEWSVLKCAGFFF